jgi:hypothetical protein
VNQAQISALEGHRLILEDQTKILDAKKQEEDHMDVLEGMYTAKTPDLNQARLSGNARGPDSRSGDGRQSNHAGNVRMMRAPST